MTAQTQPRIKKETLAAIKDIICDPDKVGNVTVVMMQMRNDGVCRREMTYLELSDGDISEVEGQSILRFLQENYDFFDRTAEVITRMTG